MKKVLFFFAVTALLLFNGREARSQMVGIGVDVPSAALDVQTTNTYSAIHVLRSLTPSASAVAGVEINDDSDWGALDIYYTNTSSPNGVGAYIETSGTGTGLWATNTDATNFNPVALITQGGVGDGIMINMLNGSGDGIYIQMFDGNNGTQIWTFDDLQNAILTDHSGYDSWAMFNILESGAGVYNIHLSPSPYSFYTDLSQFGAGSYNVAYTAYMDGSDGDGLYFSNTDGSLTGDGFGLLAFVNTRTATVGTSVYGGLLGGEQYGPGHGIIVNHYGATGRNAEFNVIGGNNSDPAIFAVHQGPGSAILVQNQDNSIPGTVYVVDAAYSGTDVGDHVGVYGYSAPTANRGVGLLGDGGDYGIFSLSDLGATGAKTFLIDHPLDPENKLLKHFSMESDKVLNVYQGTASIGRSGQARIELPAYFEAINKEFSYQLTAIGTPVQPWVAREIDGNSFIVAGKPGSKVSWMVIANRNDAYVRANPDKIVAELPKKPGQVGKFIDPASHGKPAEKGIFYRDPARGQMSELPKRPEIRPATTGRVVDKQVLRDQGRAMKTAAPATARRPESVAAPAELPRMEIRREIRTWDEIR